MVFGGPKQFSYSFQTVQPTLQGESVAKSPILGPIACQFDQSRG